MAETNTGAALVRSEDVNALMGSRFWRPLKNGMQFKVTEDGKLLDPGKAEIFGTRDAKGVEEGGLVGSLNMFNTAFGWWAGDTANAIEILYGKEEVAHFAERIDNTIEYVGKLQSQSRSYGFPKTAEELAANGLRIEELRVEGLSHAHHQVVQGLEEPQRHKALLKALKMGWSKTELQEYKTKELEGKGQKDESDKKEYPVWHVRFRAFDGDKDNPVQFVEECKAQIDLEFPYYIDPTKAEERELEQAKQKAVDGLPDEMKAQVLAAGAALDGTKFKELAKKFREKHAAFEKVEKLFTKRVKDDSKRAELIAAAKESGMDVEAAKQALAAYKKELDANASKEKTVETLVAKVKDPETRKALLERAAVENLTIEAFTPLVQDAILAEMRAEELAKINDPDYQKKLADKAAARLAPPKPRKAGGGKAADTGGLPLGKKAAKQGGKGKKKG